jgi:hypothetical protein
MTLRTLDRGRRRHEGPDLGLGLRQGLVTLLLVALGCAQDHYPPTIRGVVGLRNDSGGSEYTGIAYGGEDPYLTGRLKSLSVECYAVTEPAVRTKEFRQDRTTTYSIAATATVEYLVSSVDRFKAAIAWPRESSCQAEVVFEAVSAQGVVLASSRGTATFIMSGRSCTVSTTMPLLSWPVVSRIRTVRAMWVYQS